MFQKLVSHNPDLSSLVDRGFAVGFDSNYLVIRDIPYLGPNRELKTGAFVTKLEFIDENHVRQDDHQVFFAGSPPHGLDGQPIPNLGGGSATLVLSEKSADVVVERSFSNKPRVNGNLVGYDNFFDKIESYTRIVSGPAMELHDASPYTFRVTTEGIDDPIFKFNDTLTSRAEIGEYAAKLEEDVVAVIGLGGTGSYVLDFLVKTRVKEIRGFDADNFHVHNAYRIPGKTLPSEFGVSKAEVLQARYDNFRHGLTVENKFIDDSSVQELDGVTFAFVCVDKGSSRARIFDLLIRLKIPFIDVGMGLKKKPTGLNGMMRVTYYPAERAAEIRALNLAEENDAPEDIYHANIQIGELNAMNASMAVMQFKQVRGFYTESIPSCHHILSINELKIYEDVGR